MMRKIINTLILGFTVTTLYAGEADDLQGKLVDEKGEKIEEKYKNVKYFLYYYSTNKNKGRGDQFYTPRFLKLAKKESDKYAVIFCFHGSSKKDFEAWKKAHSLVGNFPAWRKKKAKPFDHSVRGFPWLVIKDAEGKVVQSGIAHQLWVDKKVQEYTK